MIKYCAHSIFLLLSFVTFAVWADGLQDPTRPPPGIIDLSLAPAVASFPSARGLHSVIISPAHCAAIIDGKTVVLGGQHANEMLVEVSEQGVVMLKKNGQRRFLRLFPAVGMQINEIVPPHKQALSCKFDPNDVKNNPSRNSGKKETK